MTRRTLRQTRTSYRAGWRSRYRVKCRSLMLVRNVGHLMTNPAVRLDRDGNGDLAKG